METKSSFLALARDTNLMLLSSQLNLSSWPLLESFGLFYHERNTPESLDGLRVTLKSLNIDILLIEVEEDSRALLDLLEKIVDLDTQLRIVAVFDEAHMNYEMLNFAHFAMSKEISHELLERKLMVTLKEVSLIKHKDVLHKSHADEGELEIIYLSDSLETLSLSIDCGDLSKDIFDELKKDLAHVETLFDEYIIRSKRVKTIVQKFSDFIVHLDIEEIPSEKFEAFEYLSRIVEDISVFLRQYFLERKFDDLYIIEDSLENSVDFMLAKFASSASKEDGSQMEFFDD